MVRGLCRAAGVVCVYDENCQGLEVYVGLLEWFVWHSAMYVRGLGQFCFYEDYRKQNEKEIFKDKKRQKIVSRDSICIHTVKMFVRNLLDNIIAFVY